MALRVAIVPHTHWDREWYEPFQSFRLRLVDTLDALLPLLEKDPSYGHFLLDGQMAAVDDYLEVRPEAEPRLRALASAGRLEVGPWYALMDEFLVSGETVLRNLEMGMARADAFGGPMEVGYLPDMFGHVAQMPQILRLAGLDVAVVWRGVPSEITTSAFVWEAPDGSSVRAAYLPFGYGNGALLPDDAKALVRRVGDHLCLMGPFLDGGSLLLMNGSDHLPPQPGLGALVAEANALQDDYAFEISSLSGHLTRSAVEGSGRLPHWRGELRSGARANMLMGVTSNRVDVKRATAAAERALERRAEPFAALFLPPDAWPAAALGLAWRHLVLNSAHDSICACSVDEVVDAVLGRAAEARRLGEGVARRALAALASSVRDPGPLVVNPSALTRGGLVELVVGDTGAAGDRVQVVAERPPLPESLVLDAQTVRTVLATIDGTKIGEDAWVDEVRTEEDETGIDVTVTVGPEEGSALSVEEAKQDLLARLAARPDASVRIRLVQPSLRRVVARVSEVPGFGWAPFAPAGLAHPVTVQASGGTVEVDNGLVRVDVDGGDATFALDGVGGMGRLVDGGDLGDSYNYSPPLHDRLVEAPDEVSVEVTERGPVRARVVVTARYRWPDHADASTQSREGERDVEVVTALDLRADEPTVRVATSFVNPASDHRVRVHLPLPEGASCSEAESAFGAVRRGLGVEGRPDELGLPTFPARRFVRCGGLTVVCDGVTEYELVDVDGGQARTLALTALRATGMLSRVGMTYRPFPAGPLLPVEGLQMLGRHVELRYALCTGEVDPWALADDVLLPLETVRAPGGGRRGARGSLLEVDGAVVSSVRRRAGTLEVRVFNPGDEAGLVGLGGRSGWLVDLRGRPQSAFEGAFELRPHGIATVVLPGA